MHGSSDPQLIFITAGKPSDYRRSEKDLFRRLFAPSDFGSPFYISPSRGREERGLRVTGVNSVSLDHERSSEIYSTEKHFKYGNSKAQCNVMNLTAAGFEELMIETNFKFSGKAAHADIFSRRFRTVPAPASNPWGTCPANCMA